MSLITTYNLSKSYGPLDIFAGLSLSIPPQARIALVGANGIGKTTLLRVLAGKESPSGGKLQRASGITQGFLPQEAKIDSEKTLWEEALTAVEDLIHMEEELKSLEREMGESKIPDQSLLERYGLLQERFQHQGGYTYPARIRQVLGGLGFEEDDFHKPIKKLSGGERTRAFLARLLLTNPDLLFLDEPTNHLDIQAIEWLEGYLKHFSGAMLIVSHDRYFIDEVCDHIWEMSRAGFETYRGNYSAYLDQRQDRWRRREELFQTEKTRLENELDYVKRNIAGQRTSQAKGKLRRLSRRIQAIEQLGVQAIQDKTWAEISKDIQTTTSSLSVQEAHQRLQALKTPVQKPQRLRIHLRPQQRGGDLVLRTKDLEIGYQDADQPLFSVPDITFLRRECAALIGPNGAGKTTFLKTILGQIPPYNGEVKLGANLDVGYFAQAHKDLDPQKTVLEEISSLFDRPREEQLRHYLAEYLFRGEEVFKKVSVLSGGERGRLALAKLALGDANLLLLDEPTNHLDIPSQETLQAVLASYQGTILLVSHDRYLINALATQIWKIDVREEGLDVYPGSYQEYQKVLAQREDQSKEQREGDKKAREYQAEKRSKNRALAQERRQKARLKEVEQQIKELEETLEGLSAQLTDPPQDPEKVHQLGRAYDAAQETLRGLMKEWESLLQSTS